MKKMFIVHLIAILLVIAGGIWGLIELIQWLTTQNTDVVDAFNFNCFWLIGAGMALAVVNMIVGAAKSF